jgi:hypothetical protein
MFRSLPTMITSAGYDTPRGKRRFMLLKNVWVILLLLQSTALALPAFSQNKASMERMLDAIDRPAAWNNVPNSGAQSKPAPQASSSQGFQRGQLLRPNSSGNAVPSRQMGSTSPASKPYYQQQSGFPGAGAPNRAAPSGWGQTPTLGQSMGNSMGNMSQPRSLNPMANSFGGGGTVPTRGMGNPGMANLFGSGGAGPARAANPMAALFGGGGTPAGGANPGLFGGGGGTAAAQPMQMQNLFSKQNIMKALFGGSPSMSGPGGSHANYGAKSSSAYDQLSVANNSAQQAEGDAERANSGDDKGARMSAAESARYAAQAARGAADQATSSAAGGGSDASDYAAQARDAADRAQAAADRATANAENFTPSGGGGW